MSESNDDTRKNEYSRNSIVFNSQASLLFFDKEDEDEDYNGTPLHRIYKQLENFLANGTIPSINDQKTIQRYLQHRNVEAITQGNYQEAGKFEDLKTKFMNACQIYESKKAAKNEVMLIKSDISDLRLQIEILQKQYQEKIDKAKEKDKSELDRLKRNHEDEMRQFNLYWSNPDNSIEFAKSSTELNSLRKKQKLLLIVKEFEAAEAVRAEANKLERMEAREANKNIKNVIDAKRAALEQKFESELLRARQHSIKLIEEIKMQQQKEEAILLARIKKLENDKGSISYVSRSRDRGPDTTISPRSKSIMNSFKSANKPKRLMLKPLSPATLKPAKIQPLSKSTETFS